MESEKFDLVFSGQVLPKQEVATVKANLAELFKVSSKQIDALFSGKAVVLKRNLDLASANRYRIAIKKAGARVDLLKAGATVADPAKPTTAQPLAGVDNKPTPQNSITASVEATQDKPATDNQASEKPEQPSWQVANVGVNLSEPKDNSEFVNIEIPDFEVMNAGSDILSEGERGEFIPLDIDTSAITLRDGQGNLLDEGEWASELPLIVADLDVDVLPAGADLVDESMRVSVPSKQIAELDLDLAPVGTRLEPEKQQTAKAPNVDHIQLSDFK